jgi:hypothetical protein
MSKSAINEIKKFERNLGKGKVKCLFTLDEIDASYYEDEDYDVYRLYANSHEFVDEHVDYIKQPVVGDYYCCEYCPAPYQILSVKSLNDFSIREKSKSSDENEKENIDEFVSELHESGVKYWVSLKLMPIDDIDDWQY